jgi:hypothetical protein
MAKEIKIEKQGDPRDIHIAENNRNPEMKIEELGNFLKAYADDVKRQEAEQIRQKMEKGLLSEKEEQEIKDILHINKKEEYAAPECKCKIVEECVIPGDFDGICRDLMALHARKNHDYGNAAHESYKEFGLVSYIIRLNDKMNRLKSLTKPGIAQKVTSESIEDTLMDLAAYAIMAIESLRS